MAKQDSIRMGVLLDRSAVVKARRNTRLEERADGVIGWRRERLFVGQVRELLALATVLSELPKHGHEFYSYSEIGAEGMKGGMGLEWHPAGDLLRDVQLGHVRAPICRAKVMGPRTVGQVASREDVITFVERLLDPSPFWAEMEQSFSDFERENAAHRDRLRELCADLDRKQFPDALHLWAAEVNGLRYYLTLDKKFRNVMTQTKQVPLPCVPACPGDILSELQVADLVSVPALRDEDWHPFHEGHP